MAALALAHVVKRFGAVEALRDLTLDVEAGELVVLLGASGAGKTTTLRVVAGLETPDAGDVLLDGRPVTGLEPRARDVAMAFEGYALYPQLTVFDNIAFPLRAPGRRARYAEGDVRRAVEDVAGLLGIGELLDRLPRQLSGGQRQRVALGRCLVRRPAAYLLDEPIAHLDAKLRHQLRADLKAFQRRVGVTTLWATPDQLEAVSIADRVAVIEGGRLLQTGSPEECYARPRNRTVARLVGEPPMNFAAGRLETRGDAPGLHVNGVWLPLPPPLGARAAGARGEVLVGVRPVDLALGATREPTLPGEVYVVEPTGTGAIVTVRIGDLYWKVKTTGDVRLGIGEPTRVGVNPGRLFLFDPVSGDAL